MSDKKIKKLEKYLYRRLVEIFECDKKTKVYGRRFIVLHNKDVLDFAFKEVLKNE